MKLSSSVCYTSWPLSSPWIRVCDNPLVGRFQHSPFWHRPHFLTSLSNLPKYRAVCPTCLYNRAELEFHCSSVACRCEERYRPAPRFIKVFQRFLNLLQRPGYPPKYKTLDRDGVLSLDEDRYGQEWGQHKAGNLL